MRAQCAIIVITMWLITLSIHVIKMETNDCSIDLTSIPSSGVSSLCIEPTAEVFYIPYRLNASEIKLKHCSSFTESLSLEYDESLKHNNLDAKPVSFYEHIHLSRIFYFTFPNFIKFVIILITFFIFTLNVNKILIDYSQHNTAVSVEYLNANTSTPVSVSVCFDSLFDLLLQRNRTIYVEDILQNDYILPMFSNSTANHSLEMDVKIRCILASNTVENIDDSNVHNCNDIVPPVVSIANRASKCWTFFSDINGQLTQSKSVAKLMSFDYLPMVMLQIGGPWLQYRRIFVAVHNPYILPGMNDVDFHEIKQGKLINFRAAKTVQHFKPPPSLPYCSLYRKKHHLDKRPDEIDILTVTSNDDLKTSSGMPIYRNQGECILYAMFRKLYNFDLQCISPTVIFTQNELELLHLYAELNTDKNFSIYQNTVDNSTHWTPFCKDPLNDALNKVASLRHQLERLCPLSCHTETFETPWIEEVPQKEDPQKGYVAVSFAQTVTLIRHRETLGFENFLGLIGGHLFILINVSALQLVIYLVRLVHVTDTLPNTSCCCLFQWWRRWCCLRRHY